MRKRVREDRLIEYSGVYWRLALPHAVVPAILTIIAGLLVWASRRPASGWPSLTVGPASGLAAWTLFEYAFHRWLLHHTRHRALRELFWKRLHAEHHGCRRMQDPDHHAVRLCIGLPVIGVLAGIAGLSTSSAWGPSILAGWLLGYALYAALHWRFHAGESRPGGARLIWHLWKAHPIHHLQQFSANCGFIPMFWDRRFGTYQPPAQERLKRA